MSERDTGLPYFRTSTVRHGRRGSDMEDGHMVSVGDKVVNGRDRNSLELHQSPRRLTDIRAGKSIRRSEWLGVLPG